MNSYYPMSKLKQLQEWKGKWNMIKELEALERQKVNVKELRRIKFVEYSGDFALIEKALKRNEPMKVIFTRIGNPETEISWDEPTCPKCKSLVGYAEKFCSECGQKLDWSDVE